MAAIGLERRDPALQIAQGLAVGGAGRADALDLVAESLRIASGHQHTAHLGQPEPFDSVRRRTVTKRATSSSP